MTLKARKVFSTVYTAVIVLSLASSISAQPPISPPPGSPRRIEQSPPGEPRRTEEEKKAAKELENKALALIDELLAEAGSLRLAENRVHILTSASDILWTRDEERARALAREAMGLVAAHMREAREKAAQEEGQYFDSRYSRQYNPPILNQPVLNLLAKRDAKMALEFLQLTRSLRQNDNSRDTAEEQQEMMVEMNLAAQIAENDPQTALRIAEQYLNGKLDYQAVNLWSVLQRKDPKAASALTEKIIGGLKSQDLLADHMASGLVFNVLSILRSRINETSNAPQVDSVGIQQAYRDTLEVVAAAVTRTRINDLISPDEANRARNLLMQIPAYLPDIEKFLPSRIAAVRARVAQFDNTRRQSSPHEKFYMEYGSDFHTKSVQELLAIAPKAPQELRQNLYYQIAHKAIEQGDDETARRLIREFIPDKWQANDLLSNIERSVSQRAVNEGKYAEARKSLARMRTDEQRASALAGWAAAAAGSGDEKSAREMLEEARALIGLRMQKRDQFEAQMAVAAACASLDPDLSFEIADSAIERINRLNAAEMEMRTFRGMEEGETRITEIPVAGYSGRIVPLFTALALKDFDRAVNLLKRWQPIEFRLMMSLSIAQGILGGQERGMGTFQPLRRAPSVITR